MSPAVPVAAMLALAVLVGIVGARRRGVAWADAALWLQVPVAIAFYFLLMPPAVPVPADTLRVHAPGAPAPGWRDQLSLRPAVALPDANVPRWIERVPDLATALRRHPQTQSLEVTGDGLPRRDQDAVGTLGLRFDAAAPHGLLELDAHARAAIGTQWHLRARAAPGVAQAELRDPAGAAVDSTRPDAEGRFALSGTARAAGPARFELRLLDAAQKTIDRASVPLIGEGGEGLSAILRVGAPDAEFKYWRRWAADAGIALKLRAGLSERVDLREGDATLRPAALAAADLVIVDERAWTQLDADEKAALKAAVADGLGLLLRIAGPVDAAVAAEWTTFGLKLQPAELHGLTLDAATGLRDRSPFTATPLAFSLDGGADLLRADDGTALAQWRALGRGRVAAWSLLDSYRLQLAGEPARYAALWGRVVDTLARPRAQPSTVPTVGDAWVDERVTLCQLGRAAQVQAPDGARHALLVGGDGCAADWPAAFGWHRVQSDGAERTFYVRAVDDGASLRAARDRRETERLVRDPAPATHARVPVQLPRWPLFLVWLLLAGALWWRERSAG